MPVKRKGRVIATAARTASFVAELERDIPQATLGSVNIFADVGELIMQEIERALNKSAGSAMHGARMAGRAAETGMEATGTWIAVGGEEGDGRNCQDCLDLHGKTMTQEQFLDTKYTTICDGNCRCEFVPDAATESAREIEAIATSELEGEA